MSWIGQVAYEAWVASYAGNGLAVADAWDKLPDEEKAHWNAAAQAVMRAMSSTAGGRRTTGEEDTLPPPAPDPTERLTKTDE